MTMTALELADSMNIAIVGRPESVGGAGQGAAVLELGVYQVGANV